MKKWCKCRYPKEDNGYSASCHLCAFKMVPWEVQSPRHRAQMPLPGTRCLQGQWNEDQKKCEPEWQTECRVSVAHSQESGSPAQGKHLETSYQNCRKNRKEIDWLFSKSQEAAEGLEMSCFHLVVLCEKAGDWHHILSDLRAIWAIRVFVVIFERPEWTLFTTVAAPVMSNGRLTWGLKRGCWNVYDTCFSMTPLTACPPPFLGHGKITNSFKSGDFFETFCTSGWLGLWPTSISIRLSVFTWHDHWKYYHMSRMKQFTFILLWDDQLDANVLQAQSFFLLLSFFSPHFPFPNPPHL